MKNCQLALADKSPSWNHLVSSATQFVEELVIYVSVICSLFWLLCQVDSTRDFQGIDQPTSSLSDGTAIAGLSLYSALPEFKWYWVSCIAWSTNLTSIWVIGLLSCPQTFVQFHKSYTFPCSRRGPHLGQAWVLPFQVRPCEQGGSQLGQPCGKKAVGASFSEPV